MFDTISYITATCLATGWVLDLIFGDPERLPHPVVYFGKWIAFWEHRLNKGCARKAKGAVMAIASILLVYVIAYAIMSVLPVFAHFIVGAVLVFYCLAGKTLRREVRMVFEAVDRSTEEGRKQVARIVGRDTSELSPQEIRTAALETLAENLSDGVIAPLFWYALLGLPGMMAYKMVNTLDSMIGYHSERYIDFGCWAARIDDVANYIPARLTAMLMIIASPFIMKKEPTQPADKAQNNGRAGFSGLFRFIIKYGPQHASPNSGWPEAALAGILNCRFGGPHNYFGEYFYKPYIGSNERTLNTTDMKKSILVCFLAECIAVFTVIIIVGALSL